MQLGMLVLGRPYRLGHMELGLGPLGLALQLVLVRMVGRMVVVEERIPIRVVGFGQRLVVELALVQRAWLGLVELGDGWCGGGRV